MISSSSSIEGQDESHLLAHILLGVKFGETLRVKGKK